MPLPALHPVFLSALRSGALGLACAGLALPAFAHDGPAPKLGSVAPQQQEAPRAEATAAPEWKPGLAGSILSGRFAAQHRDMGEAAKYLAESLKHDPQNNELRQQAMRAHLAAGEMAEAIAIARQLQDVAGKDPLVASLGMIDDVHKGQLDQAREAIAQPSGRGLFGVIRPAMYEWLAIAKGGLTAPIDMQETIDKSGFFAPFLHYHAALMNDVLGYGDIALANYMKASSEPAVTPYRVVEAMANYYLRKGDDAKAQALFDAYARENPESSLIPDLSSQKGKDGTVRPLVANPAEGLAELYFSTASILFGEEMTNESFIYLRLALALRPDLPPAQLMLASLYETNEEHSQAVAIYKQIKPGSVFYKRAQLRIALNVEALGRVDEALAMLRNLSEAYPDEEAALITIGDIERERRRYEAAINAYGEAISRIGTLKANDWPLLYARGIAYERAGMWNAAERDFLRALELQPSQPDVLNYLGYSWLQMGKHHKRAIEYIEVAMSARPDDAHIVDSMGWAYYHTGEYEKAVELLERAADLMPQDPTVNDHLGDAYWQVGRRTEAQFQWKRALTFNPDEGDAVRIREKVAKGLPAADARAQTIGRNEVNAGEADVQVR